MGLPCGRQADQAAARRVGELVSGVIGSTSRKTEKFSTTREASWSAYLAVGVVLPPLLLAVAAATGTAGAGELPAGAGWVAVGSELTAVTVG